MEGKHKYKVIAICSDSQKIISPCGICRQFIGEFCSDIPVVMYGGDGDAKVMRLSELLPMGFGAGDLH